MKSKKEILAGQQKNGSAKTQHVVPMNNQWMVCGSGGVRSTGIYKTQAEAIEAAKKLAKRDRSEVVVHSRDGRIKHRLSVSPADELMLRVWKDTHKDSLKSK